MRGIFILVATVPALVISTGVLAQSGQDHAVSTDVARSSPPRDSPEMATRLVGAALGMPRWTGHLDCVRTHGRAIDSAGLTFPGWQG